MDFSLTREQKDIKTAAREFARGELTAERAMEHELEHRFPVELYKKAAELGFVGLDLPEEVGGGGVTEALLRPLEHAASRLTARQRHLVTILSRLPDLILPSDARPSARERTDCRTVHSPARPLTMSPGIPEYSSSGIRHI